MEGRKEFRNEHQKESLCFIKTLYSNQKLDDLLKEISAKIKMQRAVGQGCILSPLLLNLYREGMEAISEIMEGRTVNGAVINNFRYTDDTLLIKGLKGSLCFVGFADSAAHTD